MIRQPFLEGIHSVALGYLIRYVIKLVRYLQKCRHEFTSSRCEPTQRVTFITQDEIQDNGI